MKQNIHREWFQIYSSAILEMDASRILERIQRAEQAIRVRIKELENAVRESAEAAREQQDILYALTNLKRLQIYGIPA
jgi:preprotein translocase subunit SecA